MAILVVTRPAVSIAGVYVRTTMETADKDCPKLWYEAFMPQAQSVSLCVEKTYGASWLVDMETGTFDYWAAAPVADDAPIPSGMSRTTLPEGMYAELAVPSLNELSEAYRQIFSEWLPGQRAYAPRAGAPSYELYTADFCQTGKLTLYFPLIAVA